MPRLGKYAMDFQQGKGGGLFGYFLAALPGYQAVKITISGLLIPDPVIKRAHRWAHQRNYLHSFFKPYKTP